MSMCRAATSSPYMRQCDCGVLDMNNLPFSYESYHMCISVLTDLTMQYKKLQ